MKDEHRDDPVEEVRPRKGPAEAEEIKVVDRRKWAGLVSGSGDTLTPPEIEDLSGMTEGEGSATGTRRYPTFVAELIARAEAAERRSGEILQAHKESQAGLDEFRQRLSRDLDRRVEQALARVFERLITVVDDLERAIRHAEEAAVGEPPAAGTAAPAGLVEGVRLVRERFLGVLVEQGVERIGTIGLPFDPQVAEALQTVETDDPAGDGIVLQEVQPGYRYRSQLIRPARVLVGRASGGTPAEEPPGGD